MSTAACTAAVAVLAIDGFEQSELEKPVEALKVAGATVEVISPKAGEIQGWEHHDKGRTVVVDRELADARADDYDGIVLLGGVMTPDALRLAFGLDQVHRGGAAKGAWLVSNKVQFDIRTRQYQWARHAQVRK